MASHYKLYDGMGEIIPFNARYAYPTQANRTQKSIMKIPPKNGGEFSSKTNTMIRIELPAQAYLNTAGSFLEFDVEFRVDPATTNCHLQNNAQSWIEQAGWQYGSLTGEEIRGYNKILRKITEGAGTNNTWNMDQTTLTDGVGGLTTAVADDGALGAFNVRNSFIQTVNPTGGVPVAGIIGKRRYQVQLMLGLFQQGKLVPLKWMASQVAILLTLADFQSCVAHTGPVNPNDHYVISNVNFVAELYEFDGTYDAAILNGLREGGLPIKFSSWNTYIYQPLTSNAQTINIPERNRSLKAAFCVQTPPARGTTTTGGLPWDSHTFLESSTGLDLDLGISSGWIKDYQWRIGGKYYPSQPVVCGDAQGSNGAVEAYQHFAKALNIVGDFRLSTAINTARWSSNADQPRHASNCIDWWASEAPGDQNPRTSVGPTSFVIAADFETSHGQEVSGLNGEEQNDIALMINYSGGQSPLCAYQVFVYYDVLMILRENNMVELIK